MSLALLPAQAFVSCQSLALGLEREITSPFLKVNYCWFNPRLTGEGLPRGREYIQGQVSTGVHAVTVNSRLPYHKESQGTCAPARGNKKAVLRKLLNSCPFPKNLECNL